MKLAGSQAAAFCRKPDVGLKSALIHGPDAGLIAARRQELTRALLEGSDDDLRLSQLPVNEVRKDASLLDAELKARGFFPGRRVVLVDSATDGLTKSISSILESTDTEDAFLILTAGVLPARSSLRKFFEADPSTISLQLFSEAPALADIEQALREAGLSCGISADALHKLKSVTDTMDYGSYTQLVEIIGIYGISHADPLSLSEIDLILPAQQDAETDRFVDAVANGDAATVGPLLRRLETSGTKPTTLLIALQRKFRQLLLAASAEGGPEAGLSLIKPPLWGHPP